MNILCYHMGGGAVTTHLMTIIMPERIMYYMEISKIEDFYFIFCCIINIECHRVISHII